MMGPLYKQGNNPVAKTNCRSLVTMEQNFIHVQALPLKAAVQFHSPATAMGGHNVMMRMHEICWGSQLHIRNTHMEENAQSNRQLKSSLCRTASTDFTAFMQDEMRSSARFPFKTESGTDSQPASMPPGM